MEYKGGVSHKRLHRGTDFLKASRGEREMDIPDRRAEHANIS